MRPAPEQYITLRTKTAFRVFRSAFLLGAAILDVYVIVFFALFYEPTGGTPSIDFGPFNGLLVAIMLTFIEIAVFIAIQTLWAHRMPGARRAPEKVARASVSEIAQSGLILFLKVFYWVIIGALTIVFTTYFRTIGILFFPIGIVLYFAIKWLSQKRKVETPK